MRTRITLWLGVSFSLLATVGSLQAGVVNGSFESWDFLGWTFHSDEGSRAEAPFIRPAGLARTAATWGGAFGLDPVVGPMEGNRFLQLNTRNHGAFLGNDSYGTFLSQTISLNLGDSVSGWSLFYNGDVQPLDSAWVRILDQAGNSIATPWMEISGATVSALVVSSSPAWTQWQWQAPSSGNYTIQLGMTTSGANNSASVGLFDGIKVQANAVPEPATLALGLLGGLMLIALRNRTR